MVALIGKGGVGESLGGRVGVYEDAGVARNETVPLAQWLDGLPVLGHLVVEGLLLLRLVAHGLAEESHALLEDLDNVGLELGEVALHAQHVLTARVLLLELLVESVVDAAMDKVRVVAGVFAAQAVEGGGARAQQVNVLLRLGFRLLDGFCALAHALCELLLLVLDLYVQALENGENAPLERGGSLSVGV